MHANYRHKHRRTNAYMRTTNTYTHACIKCSLVYVAHGLGMYSEVIAKDPSGKAATATKRATKGGEVYARVVRVNRWGKHAVPTGSKYQGCFAVPGVSLRA